jgi:hypothetical protein
MSNHEGAFESHPKSETTEFIGINSTCFKDSRVHHSTAAPFDPFAIEENPFEKHDTLWVKVIEVKRGYVRYEQKTRNWEDTSSSHIGWLRHFTPVK